MARMYSVDQFTSNVALTAAIHRWEPGKAAALQAIATALSSDTTQHDTTLATAPVGLRPGARGATPFVKDVLLVVNAGKAGNLTTTEMSDAITAGISEFFPPVNTTAPLVTGTTALSCTMGNWTNAPTSYAYQWLRGGTAIGGATANTYTVVGADSGTNVSCRVTASNAAGSTPAVSNAIAIP